MGPNMNYSWRPTLSSLLVTVPCASVLLCRLQAYTHGHADSIQTIAFLFRSIINTLIMVPAQVSQFILYITNSYMFSHVLATVRSNAPYMHGQVKPAYKRAAAGHDLQLHHLSSWGELKYPTTEIKSSILWELSSLQYLWHILPYYKVHTI